MSSESMRRPSISKRAALIGGGDEVEDAMVKELGGGLCGVGVRCGVWTR